MFNDFWPKAPLQGGLSLNPEYRNNADTVGLFHTFDGGMRDISRFQRRIRKVDAGGDLIETVGELGRTTLFTAGGTADRYTFGQIPIADPVGFAGSDKINISIWIDFNDAMSGNYGRIIDKSDGGSASNGWYLSAQDTLASPTLEFSINSDFDVAPSGFLLTGLHHYLVNYDGAFVRWYRDGEFFDANAMTGTITSAATDMAIGQWNHSSIDRHFSGLIYSIEVNRGDWNRDRANVEAHALWDPQTRWDMFAQDHTKPFIFFAPAGANVDVTTQTKAVTIAPIDVTVDAGTSVSVTTQTKAVSIAPFDVTVTAASGAAFSAVEFEGNNHNVASSSVTGGDTSTPTMDIAPYLNNGGKWGVACARAVGLNGKTPTFRIDRGTYTVWSGMGAYNLQWTTTPYDIDSWQFFDNKSTSGNVDSFSNNAAFTDDEIYVSTARFMTRNVMVAWLDKYAENPYLHKPQSVKAYNGTSQWAFAEAASVTDENGRTIPAQELIAARITDLKRYPADGKGKRKIAMYSNAHANEDIGSEVMFRALDFLMNAAQFGTADQIAAWGMLRDFDIYFYPYVNIGRYNHHAYGLDTNTQSPYQPNAHWDDTRPFTMDWHEAHAVALELDMPSGSTHFLIDYHSQGSDTFDVEIWPSPAMNATSAPANYKAAVDPYLPGVVNINEFSSTGAVREYFEQQYSVTHAYAYEVPYSNNLTQAEITVIGTASMRGIADRFSADMDQTLAATKISETITAGGNLSGLKWALFHGDDLESGEPPFLYGGAESTTSAGLIEIDTTDYLEVGQLATLIIWNYAGDPDPDTYDGTPGVVAAKAGALT